jgi:tRNA (guanine-N7-)-methyltransferase
MNDTPEKPLNPTDPNTDASSPHRIRSFIRRQGRLTVAQSRAMEELWPVYGLKEDQSLHPDTVFGRSAPLVLEIGFGNGESLAAMAAAHPDQDFIGIEVHTPGVGHLLLCAERLGLKNLRVYCADAIDILSRRIDDGSLQRIQLFFPDPWPKKRHHKRRIVNNAFLELVCRKLKPSGIFHAATDWEPYALHMAETLDAYPGLNRLHPASPFVPRPDYRPLTKFETRGQRLGYGVWDLLYRTG